MSFDDIKTVSELIAWLEEELGDECDWEEITSSERSNILVRELENELSAEDFSALGVIKAAARCMSRDEVLFCLADGRWHVYHLTYSAENTEGFPRFREFENFAALAEYFIGRYGKYGVRLHRLSFENEELLKKAERCGCFYCGKKYSPREVTFWINDAHGRTAVCPYCGIDAVLQEANDGSYELDDELLRHMNYVWFGGGTFGGKSNF